MVEEDMLSAIWKRSKIHGLRFVAHGRHEDVVFNDVVMQHTITTDTIDGVHHTSHGYVLVFLAKQLKSFIETLQDCW